VIDNLSKVEPITSPLVISPRVNSNPQGNLHGKSPMTIRLSPIPVDNPAHNRF
jgi:hypothetical protein